MNMIDRINSQRHSRFEPAATHCSFTTKGTKTRNLKRI